jgi:hypothetical protein
MDWGRYLRAMEAEHIGNIEEKRQAQISGIIEPKDVNAAEWEAIQEHTEWLEELDGDQ